MQPSKLHPLIIGIFFFASIFFLLSKLIWGGLLQSISVHYIDVNEGLQLTSSSKTIGGGNALPSLLLIYATIVVGFSTAVACSCYIIPKHLKLHLDNISFSEIFVGKVGSYAILLFVFILHCELLLFGANALVLCEEKHLFIPRIQDQIFYGIFERFQHPLAFLTGLLFFISVRSKSLSLIVPTASFLLILLYLFFIGHKMAAQVALVTSFSLSFPILFIFHWLGYHVEARRLKSQISMYVILVCIAALGTLATILHGYYFNRTFQDRCFVQNVSAITDAIMDSLPRFDTKESSLARTIPPKQILQVENTKRIDRGNELVVNRLYVQSGEMYWLAHKRIIEKDFVERSEILDFVLGDAPKSTDTSVNFLMFRALGEEDYLREVKNGGGFTGGFPGFFLELFGVKGTMACALLLSALLGVVVSCSLIAAAQFYVLTSTALIHSAWPFYSVFLTGQIEWFFNPMTYVKFGLCIVVFCIERYVRDRLSGGVSVG